MNLSTGNVTTLAGGATGFVDGVGAAAKFNYMSSISIDLTGSFALVVGVHEAGHIACGYLKRASPYRRIP